MQNSEYNSDTDIQAVVIGGRGMLGVDLIGALKADGTFARAVVGDLPEVDIRDDASLRKFFKGMNPAVIFNCAAYTDVDGCESKPDLAFAVNGAAAGNLAALAASLGARLIHVSTDYVFDGKKRSPYVEDDPPAPLSVYGASKLEGERLVAERGDRWVIARSAWLYGRAGRNFVDLMIGLARERKELKGVTDQVGSPTWTRDLAAALVALARCDAQGIFHTVNAGACSRYEQVKFIVECAGLKTTVRPVDSAAFPRPAAVPAYCPLSVEKLREETGHLMRPWQDALKEYVLSQCK